MDSVMFFPWVGCKYQNGGIFKKKILILGEAHYCETPEKCGGCWPGERHDCNGLTINVIRDQMSEKGHKHAIYTKLFRLFLGKERYLIMDKIEFWNSVAFYNFIQTSVSDKPRIPPTAEMWSISKSPYYEVMKLLEPDFLLILGDRLWNHIPGQEKIDWPEGPIINENNIIERTWYFKGETKNTLSLIIKHPSSSRFSYDYIPIIKKAIALS